MRGHFENGSHVEIGDSLIYWIFTPEPSKFVRRYSDHHFSCTYIYKCKKNFCHAPLLQALMTKLLPLYFTCVETEGENQP